ncbi:MULTISPECIES: DUF6212 domain-containing protein [Brucella]|uniref:DUF6212 domain-containing protein n=1 Tax=Brucella TaxID=234 RepID=UPI0009A1C59E|nr:MULTISPECIES: DUF6212 domain-containing protein [Brucella]MQP41522.1 hypothetical protein [Ochrobactrum sp. MYb237]KAB2687188.1 hypothetical protein F9K82_17540 [Brucella pseudogrignonensis]MCD4510044.1 hypothetical protein [Brucella pseudogrignonensis]PQZ40081.1 hypothetical protein CQ059_12285 [Brucella pseudogrignonensis]PRA39760.1 hypothetical protein CQ063_16455 [Brucella pseudogrignonensis]
MLSTPLPAISARKTRRYAIASMRDREALESTSLGELTAFVEGDGKRLRLANTFPLVAVAASDEGAKELNGVLQQLYRMRTIPEVPVVRVDEASPETIPLLVSQLLENGLDRLVGHVSKVHAELAMLRRERETMFENYRAIEDAFHARNWDSSTEIFSHAPLVDPKDEGFARLLRESEIEQLFPVSSYAVSGFALHFRDMPANRNGQLIVTLDYLENGEGIAEWLVPYATLHSEWNFFSLPKACDGSHRTLRLRISATGGVPPELSLGNVIANERYAARARIPHGDLDMRPLALRIFTGLPGVRPASLPNAIVPTSLINGRKVDDYRLPIELLRNVANVSVTPLTPDFPTVRFLEHEDAIGCHPLEEGITAAAIRRVVAPGTVRISARAVIDHPEGQPCVAGLLLVNLASDVKEEIDAITNMDRRRAQVLFSGWSEVAPNRPIDINFMLEEPIDRTMDLIVLSKAAGDSVDFSWLKIFNFRLVKHIEAASPVQELAKEVANVR